MVILLILSVDDSTIIFELAFSPSFQLLTWKAQLELSRALFEERLLELSNFELVFHWKLLEYH